MKKRIVIAMVTGLVIASLAGCGTQADAANQSPESSSAVESQTEPAEPEINVETETESTESSEINSSEVVGNETEKPGATGDLEDENIILYAEKREKGLDIIPDELEYTPYDGVVNAETVIGLCDGKGYRVGEMKIGGTVYVGEIDRINNLGRFKNPIEGTEYDYLYVSGNKVQNNNMTKLTASEAEDLIKELIGNFDIYTITEKTDDMEVCEFMIPVYYNVRYDDLETPSETIFFILRDSCDEVWPHRTLAIECVEDIDDYILCQIYYKD